jgi:hypothetical protein
MKKYIAEAVDRTGLGLLLGAIIVGMALLVGCNEETTDTATTAANTLTSGLSLTNGTFTTTGTPTPTPTPTPVP